MENFDVKILTLDIPMDEEHYNKIKAIGLLDDECIEDLYKALDDFIKRNEVDKNGN